MRQTYNNFHNGIDCADTTVGSRDFFWRLTNCHLTRKKTIERRKAIRAYGTANLSTTFGLAHFQGTYYVFGTMPAPVNLPAILTYVKLPYPPGNPEMDGVLDTRLVDGSWYVVASFTDGSVHHYYAGVRVTDWDVISEVSTTVNGTASLLADKVNRGSTGITATALSNTVTLSGAAGQAFTVSGTSVNGGSVNDQGLQIVQIQASSAPTVETRASGRVILNSMDPGAVITAITVNGVGILGTPVSYQGSITATLDALAQTINGTTSSPNYTAYYSGSILYILASAGTGASPNGFVVAESHTGTASLSVSPMGSGVTAVAGLSQVTNVSIVGAYEAADTFTLTINDVGHTVSGVSSGTGRAAFYFKNAMYSPVGTTVRKSALNDFYGWVESKPEAGFFSTENYSDTPAQVYGINKFQGKLAIFAENSIQLWNSGSSITELAFFDAVENEGCTYPKTITPYGALDIFFKGQLGIRSLTTLTQRVAPSVTDMGVLVDPRVQEAEMALAPNEREFVMGFIEPEEQRLWMVFGKKVFVYTNYPSLELRGWSEYDLEFSPTGWAVGYSPDRTAKRLALRDASTFYFYGGENGDQYPAVDEAVAVVQPRFVTGDDQVYRYSLSGIDVNVTNEWKANIAIDNTRPDDWIPLSVVHGNTYNGGRIRLPNHLTNTFAPVMVCSNAGPASISSISVYYSNAKENS